MAAAARFGRASAQDAVNPERRPGEAQSTELTLRDRAVAAGAAAVLSAVVMNPLDVAKTRLQAQASGYTYTHNTGSANCNNCGTPWPDPITRRHLSSYQMEWLRGALDTGHLRAGPREAVSAAAQDSAACAVACDFPVPTSKAYRGPLDVFLRVVREEGLLRLWRGTSAGLVMAVPSVGIYMPVYDTLRAKLEVGPSGEPLATAPYAPLLAGSVSRSLACVLCAPLELARTRIQAASADGPSSPGPGPKPVRRGIVETLRHAVETEAARSRLSAQHGRTHGHASSRGAAPGALWQLGSYQVLWRGVDAHLARDVPFSAICWSILEPARRLLLAVDVTGRGVVWAPAAGGGHTYEEEEQRASLARILAANFGAGMVAGSLAAAVTTPLDMAKTRVQIEGSGNAAGRGVGFHLRQVWREGGLRALYTGLVPRSIKAGPSVGIIVSFYEIMKALLVKQQD